MKLLVVLLARCIAAYVLAFRSIVFVLCLCVVLFWTIPSVQAQSPQRSYIIPDVCAPSMATYIEIIGQHNLFGNFGKDSIYANNPGDSVRVELERPEDSTRVVVGPLTVAWNGRMISTHIFVLPNVQPNDSIWSNLRKEFRIPLRVIVRGRPDSIRYTDTVYIVRPFTRVESYSRAITADSIVIGTTLPDTTRSLRSRRGAIIAESVSLQAGKKYSVSTVDTDPGTFGNQGYLPFVWLVRGLFDGNGASVDVNGGGKNGGPGGGGGGGSVQDPALFGSSGNSQRSRGGDGFTGGAAGGLNNAGRNNPSSWASGGTGSFTFQATGDLPTGRSAVQMDGGASLNGVHGGLSGNNFTEHPQSAGGGTGHPFGLSGLGWDGNPDFDPLVSAGGGHGRKEGEAGDAGGYGRGGFSSAKGSGVGGGGEHGNIMVIPIAGGSGGASGNPQGVDIWSGAGGGGGGAIRVAGATVRNVSVFARGAARERGTMNRVLFATFQGPDGGEGSGGHVGVQSKTRAEGIKADVRGGADENTGSGRIRFDTPNSIPANAISPQPQSFGETGYHSSMTLDTMAAVRSPYSSPFFVRGSSGFSSKSLRFYIRTTTGTWQQKDTMVGRKDATFSADANLPVAYRDIFPPTNGRPGTAQDSLLFIVGAEELNTLPANIPPYTIHPLWILTQAAANILRVQPLPLISVSVASGRDTLFAPFTRCQNDMNSTTITITVRNNRGGLLEVNNITFRGEAAPYLRAEPSNFTVVQGASRQVTVRFTGNASLPASSNFFTADMLIAHNDTFPDIGFPAVPGTARPSPWTIKLTIPVNTVRYTMSLTSTGMLQTAPQRDTVLDFGRVGLGGVGVTERLQIANVAPIRTPLRYTVRGAQPLTSTPFQFAEITDDVSPSGTIAFPITFSPTRIGAASEQRVIVQLRNTDGNCPFSTTYTVILRGTGVQPQLDTTRSTRSLDFATLSVCAPSTTARALPIVLFNSGNDSIEVRNIRMSSSIISSTNPSATPLFTPTVSNLVVPVGGSQSFMLRYQSPTTTRATQIVRDTVLLETNDARFGQSNPYRIPVSLTLNSFNPSLRLIPPDTVLAFGATRYLSKPQRTVFLANNGNVGMTVTLDTSALRAPFRLVAPQTTRLSLLPGATEEIRIEAFPTENLPESVLVRGLLRFIATPSIDAGVQCPFVLAPLVITLLPRGPASMQATLWLDTLSNVNMRRDTVIRLWGRVETAVQGRADNLRAAVLIRRSMFFPKAVRSAFGAASIETTQVRDRDRAVIVNVSNVALSETPSVIAEIQGTPILTDTAWANVEWLPAETAWSRRDSVYFTERLQNGFIATYVPLLRNQPRLVSGPVIGQMPRQNVLVSISPNPARDEINLEIRATTVGEYVVQIVNTLGQRVASSSRMHDAKLEARLSLPLDVRSIPAGGTYLVRVITPAGESESALVRIER